MSNKSYGIRKENERVRWWRQTLRANENAEVFHARGSLGTFDIVAIEPYLDASEFWCANTFLISVKAGSQKYVRQCRNAFRRWAENRPTICGQHLVFDSQVRGSGQWKSETYPGDFEKEG
jgi:hypothetical protein